MGLPADFSKTLHNKTNFYAAWVPVETPFRVGDYGLITGGVFQKIGHLEDLRSDGFNVELRKESGHPTPIDFYSEGTRAVKTVAGASVPDLPAVDAEAKLTFEFSKKNSFVVKAAKMNVELMANIREVADGLARLRRQHKWSHRYRVVSGTHTAQNCLVLLSSEANTKVEFEASAKALKQLDLGDVTFNPGVSFCSETIVRFVGKSGPIGLNLFKLSFWSGHLQTLGTAALSDDEKKIEDKWGDELTDDI